MYEVMKNLFTTTTYALDDAEGRIDYAVARGRITPEQAQELLTLAQTHAVDEGKTIEARVSALEQTVNVDMELAARTLEMLGVDTGYGQGEATD